MIFYDRNLQLLIHNSLVNFFFVLSNISASENLLFSGCPVFDRLCIYFALLSLLVFCAVLLIKKHYTTIVTVGNVYNQFMICLCYTYVDLIYEGTNPSNQVYDEINFKVEELRVMNMIKRDKNSSLGM